MSYECENKAVAKHITATEILAANCPKKNQCKATIAPTPRG